MVAQKSKAKTGRPTRLCDPARSAIQAVRLGMRYGRAARLARVAESTFYHWMAQRRMDQKANRRTEFSEFLEDIQRAEAELIRESLKELRKHHETSWRSIAWFLERRFPEEFGGSNKELRSAIREFMAARAEIEAERNAGNLGS